MYPRRNTSSGEGNKGEMWAEGEMVEEEGGRPATEEGEGCGRKLFSDKCRPLEHVKKGK